MVAQQGQPRGHGSGDRRRERARPGHQVQAELVAKVLDARSRRSGALTAQHGRALVLRGGEDGGHVPTRPVLVRFDDLEDEPRGGGSVEGVTAGLEGGHPRAGGEPVGGRDHPEGAEQLGSRGEVHDLFFLRLLPTGP